MEESSFVANEEPSVFPTSEFNPGHQDDKGIQEEYEAEQKDIEEGVDRQLAEIGDDDLDLVESEDEDSDDYANQISPNTINQHLNINTMNPLSRNVANIHRTGSFDQQSPGIPGQFRTSTQIGQTNSNLFQNHDKIHVNHELGPVHANGIRAMTERKFLHTEDENENIDRLPILYEVRCQEIRKLKDEIDEINRNNEIETRKLNHELTLLKTEHVSLIARCDSAKEDASLQLEEKLRIKDDAEELSRKLSESENIRNQLQEELDSTRMTLTTLHSQHKELQQSDTVFKAKQMHEANVSSLRERHEKELFRLHQEINKLQVENNRKDNQIDLIRKNAGKIQTDYDILQIEKNDIIKEYQNRLKDAQNRLQQQISENASYNYTNVKAIEERAREDKEKYAQELLKFKDKEEEFLLLQRRNDELKSKYASLKQKVVKYQEHQRRKEEKYQEQIRQTDEECRTRLVDVRNKTKEAIESKNRQYQEEVLQMQKMFEVEMEKVATMTIKCSENILNIENDRNAPNIEAYTDLDPSNQIPFQYASNNKPSGNHITSWDRDNKENQFSQNKYNIPQKIEATAMSKTAVSRQPSGTVLYTEGRIGDNLEPTTDNLNKVN